MPPAAPQSVPQPTANLITPMKPPVVEPAPTSPPLEVAAAANAPAANPAKKTDPFADLEALEAEMSRLLGRDP